MTRNVYRCCRVMQNRGPVHAPGSDGERGAAAEYACRRVRDPSAPMIPGLTEETRVHFYDQALPPPAPRGAGCSRCGGTAGRDPSCGDRGPGRRGDPRRPGLYRVRAGGDESRAVLPILLRVRRSLAAWKRLSASCPAGSVAAGNLQCCWPRTTPAAASISRLATATGMSRASCRLSVPAAAPSMRSIRGMGHEVV